MAESANHTASKKRVLDPIERISEVLFGLIMVLTFTCSFSIADAGKSEIRAMLVGALGCNLAWGIIDGIMYLMRCLADKAHGLTTLRSVQKASDPLEAQRLVSKALPSVISSILGQPELDRIRQQLQNMPVSSDRPRLSKRDWIGSAGVFLLVVITTFPVVVPFLFMQNVTLAQRVSNGIAIGLLYLTGYAFGRCTGYHPQGMGIGMVAIGTALVGITIMLGG
jgi:hypothetical protein